MTIIMMMMMMMQGSETGLKQWMVWCDEKIKKFGDKANNKTDDAKSITETRVPEAEEKKPEAAAADAQLIEIDVHIMALEGSINNLKIIYFQTI